MNVKKISLLMLLLTIGLVSCENEATVNNEESNGLKFKNLNLNFDFKFDDSEIDLSTSRLNVNQIINGYVLNVQKVIKSNNLKAVKYQITLDDKKIKITDFSVIDSSGNKNGEWTTLDEAFYCPGGQELIDTCWSQQCVEDAVSSQAENFSNGESISIHHTGTFGGVKICSNVQP